MPLNPFTIIPNAIRAYFGPQVIAPNTLNPFQLAVGTKAYWIQSRILCIPDQYGFFSPGPPRLQVYQAARFNTLCFMTLCEFFFGTFVVALIRGRLDHPPLWRAVLAMMALQGSVWALIWVTNCFDKRRAFDYEWKDWKMKKYFVAD